MSPSTRSKTWSAETTGMSSRIRGCCDPPVRFWELLAQRMPCTLTAIPQRRTHRHEPVIGLHDGESRKIPFERPPAQISPAALERPESKFGDGHERQDDIPTTDQVEVRGSDPRIPCLTEQRGGGHRVDHGCPGRCRHLSASAAIKASHSSSGTSPNAIVSMSGSGRA